jgi:hypothetical protein
MNNMEMAAVLRKIASILDPSGEAHPWLPAAEAVQERKPTASGDGVKPWDPAHRDYTPACGWQVMLRRYARDAGLTDSNAFVKDRYRTGDGDAPIWPDEKQDWEP